MAKSMTGYGRCEAVFGEQKISVEIKSVNHRYLDLNIKMPRKLNPLESNIRNYIKENIARGKVDLYISIEDSKEKSQQVVYHGELASQYLNCLEQMAKDFSLETDIKLSNLSRYPDVLEIKELETDEEELFSHVMECIQNATEQFVNHRQREGQRLVEDLEEKLDELNNLVSQIETIFPDILQNYQERLYEKLEVFIADEVIDKNRLAAEMVIYSDKICVDEEIVRLKCHIEETKRTLHLSNEVGRRLDFIAQELNREANTILSKSTDAQIANIGIDLKTLIEKIREQIQNLE